MTNVRRLTRTTLGDNFTEGARRLWVATRGLGTTRAAAMLGCSRGMLTHWLYGDRIPTARWATIIQTVFKVQAADWGRKPTKAFELPAVAQNRRATGTEG